VQIENLATIGNHTNELPTLDWNGLWICTHQYQFIDLYLIDAEGLAQFNGVQFQQNIVSGNKQTVCPMYRIYVLETIKRSLKVLLQRVINANSDN
jgi:hypothetical protein